MDALQGLDDADELSYIVKLRVRRGDEKRQGGSILPTLEAFTRWVGDVLYDQTRKEFAEGFVVTDAKPERIERRLLWSCSCCCA